MKKILLVEDNKDISKNITEYLQMNHFEVIQVFDWEKALYEALKYDYNLILLDIWLPKWNWFYLCENILKNKQVPIIFITARELIEDKIFWLKIWAKDYIVKPFDLRELLLRINIHIEKQITKNTIFKQNNIKIDFEKRIILKWKKSISIPPKEWDILQIIINNWKNITSRTSIIELIWWEKALFDSDWKLDVYISHLRDKLGKDFIKTVKGVWYTL